MIAARIDASGRAWCGRTGCKAGRAFGAYYYRKFGEVHARVVARRPDTHPDVTAEAMQRVPNGFGDLLQEARALGIDWLEEIGPGRIQPEPFGEEAARDEDTFGGLPFPWMRLFAFDGHWILGDDGIHRRAAGHRRGWRRRPWTSAGGLIPADRGTVGSGSRIHSRLRIPEHRCRGRQMPALSAGPAAPTSAMAE